MKKFKKINHRLAAIMTAGMMVSGAGSAFSAPNTNSLVANLKANAQGFTDMIGLIGYIGGSGYAMAGIFKLKQHSDNPQATPLKDGLMRLAAGGGLLSVPFM